MQWHLAFPGIIAIATAAAVYLWTRSVNARLEQIREDLDDLAIRLVQDEAAFIASQPNMIEVTILD